MKKLMILAVITALSVATVAEAKRGGGFRMMKSKPQTSQQQKRPDADFNNTPNAMPNNAATQAQSGNRMGNFVTGAAAGYLLSNMLSPTEAQAQQQAVGSTLDSANPAANVQTFKQLDPTDPNLIERNASYARYCLGGVQYIVNGSKAIALMDSQNQPQRCVIEK
ncbi:hypothetical protein A6B43_08610 [Vespertiliibacter pulmonis]|nr:hypothetical protein [Vespertiliibacter pulmonis]QLB21681.1 hypothetical protein A6B43_08610 [Vespertiliibacter pulmonis]